jgi:hypothetical protein
MGLYHICLLLYKLKNTCNGLSLAQPGFTYKHDDRKGHHYYTPSSQAEAVVYSSDDPCGHHGAWAVIMLRKNPTRTHVLYLSPKICYSVIAQVIG